MKVKKHYEAPQMKVHQVKPASIICTSGKASTESLKEEDYSWDGAGVKEEQGWASGW